MTNLFDEIRVALADKNVKIVLPEGTDKRVLQAASRIAHEGIVTPILIGPRELIMGAATQAKVELTGIEIVDPVHFEKLDECIDQYVERRNGKTTPTQARIQLKDVNTLGAMFVYTGDAQGVVSGAIHSMDEIVRPALQLIQTKPGVSKTSGAFLMVQGDVRYLFADCAITIAPTSEELAGIAVESAQTAMVFGIEPKVAMLSFSTKGSFRSPEAQKVAEATKLAQKMAPTVTIEGEIQFDAAFVPTVAAKKARGSAIQGDANVFVFPSLEAGNIGYQLTKQFGGFEVFGPLLQGLNKPVNNVSQDCSADDIYKLVLMTAFQSVMVGES